MRVLREGGKGEVGIDVEVLVDLIVDFRLLVDGKIEKG